MKKVFLTIGLFLATFLTVNAQEISENAIGIRFGNNNGFGGEVSYQRKLSDNNRLEVDLGIRKGNAFKATGLYQWVWQLEERFNWFAGVGGGIAAGKGSTALFGAGVIGIEYSFNDFYDGFQSDFGLGVRYQF